MWNALQTMRFAGLSALSAVPMALTLAVVVGVGLAACGSSSPLMNTAPGYAAFEHHGVQPVVDTAEEKIATVGLASDRASYRIACHYLDAGRWPPAASVRVEDFLTALTSRVPIGPAWLSATLGPSPLRPGWSVLVLAIAPGRLGWEAGLTVQRVMSDRDGPLERAFSRKGVEVVRGGLTDAVTGAGHVVVIGTAAGLGGPDAQEALLDRLSSGPMRGGLVSVVGRIEAGLDDALLDAAARAGGGAYEIVETGSEDSLVMSLTKPLLALDARIEVRFDGPRRWRLVGHESTSPAPWSGDVRGSALRDEVVHLVFELDLGVTHSRRLGSAVFQAVRVGANSRTSVGPVEIEPRPPDQTHDRVVLVAMIAEVLRGSYWSKDVGLDALVREAARIGDEDVEALVTAVVEAAPRVRTVRPSRRESPLP